MEVTPNSIEVKQKEDIERRMQERKEKIKELLKKDKLLTLFLILSILSLINLIPGISQITGIMLDSKVWWILFISFAIASVLCYKNMKQLLFIPGLLLSVFISTFIRTRNLYGLKDITTGGWTLGPDLDPFLFLRYAKYIVEHGSLMAVDTMRYVPLGFETAKESMLLPYMIAYTHKILSLFISNVSIEYSSVIFPVIMFAFTIIAFFFLVRKIFEDYKYKDIIATISSLFLAASPSILSRTIAGIPEKESAAFLFLFLAFYFFIISFKEQNIKKIVIFSILAGISTATMGLIWGGHIMIYYTITISVFLAFIFNKIDNKRLIAYSIWITLAILILILFTERFTLLNFIKSPEAGGSLGILAIILLDRAWHRIPQTSKILENVKNKYHIPTKLTSFILSILTLTIIISILFGPDFILSQISSLYQRMTVPVTYRHALTVAENKQPYFNEWVGGFGPNIKNIFLTFWLFFLSSVYLFYKTTSSFDKKERFGLTSLYLFMILGICFSRYNSNSSLNGTNTISLIFYFGSIFLFILGTGYYYRKNYLLGKTEKFMQIDFAYILLFSYFFISLIGARSAVRLIMILSPPVAILLGFLMISVFNEVESKIGKTRYAYIVLACFIALITSFSLYYNYIITNSTATNFVPYTYTFQWQKAMQWVRENTAENAVFTHWWDYGYWLQSIGNRATMLDGGNAVGYWNHFMGRYGLTGTDPRKALELFYAHNVTHYLIDSSDIGKYGAYASIGGDKNKDRNSFMPIILLNDKAVQEARNDTVYIYGGYSGSGIALDEDVIIDNNGTREIFPASSSGIGAVMVKIDKNTSKPKQPEAIFVYQGKQRNIPLRYLYINNKLIDFKSGIESGLFVFPRVDQQGQNININPIGAAIYLSKRTVNSMVAQLFLFNQSIEGFELKHVQDDAVIENLKAQGADVGNFIFFGDIKGPIKIWEIHYPKDITLNPEFLETDYPQELQY